MPRITQLENEPKNNGKNTKKETPTTTQATGRVKNTKTTPQTTAVQNRKTTPAKTPQAKPTETKQNTVKSTPQYNENIYGSSDILYGKYNTASAQKPATPTTPQYNQNIYGTSDIHFNDKEQMKSIINGQRASDTQRAIDKMLTDTNKDGRYSEKDVGYYDNNGQFTLHDYGTQLKDLYTQKDATEKALSEAKNARDAYVEAKSKGEATDTNIDEIYKQIDDLTAQSDELGKNISEVENRQKYQNAYVGQKSLDYAVENNDSELLENLNNTYASYDDDFFERRTKNVAKIAVDMGSSILSLYDIVKDVGGDAIAEAWQKDAQRMLDSGTINEERYNQILEDAQKLASFDASDPTNVSTQLREYSNQIAYEIQNGEDGIGAFIGQGLDSTANFLAQFALLGETGSLLMMGAQSGTQKYFENLERGYSKETALLNATLTGITSYVVEKIGMDNFVSIVNGTKGQGVVAQAINAIAEGKGNYAYVLDNIISQGLAEGLEEGVEGNVDYLWDALSAKFFNGEPVEYNAGDIFYGMAVGAFSGALMGATGSATNYNLIVNTREQYNAMMDDAKSLMQIRQQAIQNGEDVSDIDEALKTLEVAGKRYEDLTTTEGINFVDELAQPNPDALGEKEILTEAIRPTADAEFEQTMEKEELINRITDTTQYFLSESGINMPVNEFVDMSYEERQNLLEQNKKAEQAFPNVKLAYTTSIPDNAFVLKMEGSTPVIVVNPRGETSAVVSTVHEVVHTLENSEEYQELFNTVFQDANAFGNKFAELSTGRYEGDTAESIEKEALTVALTEDLLKDEGASKFIDHMAKYNTSTAYKLWYKLRDTLGIFKDNSQLGKITSLLTNALDNQDIGYFEDGISFSKGDFDEEARNLINDVASKKRPVPKTLNESRKLDTIALTKKENGKTVFLIPEWANALGWRKIPHVVLSNAIVNSQWDWQNPETDVFKSSEHQNESKGTENPKDRIDRKIVENLNVLYENPLAVYKSSKREGDVLLLLKATSEHGDPIIMAVSPYKNVVFKNGDYIASEFVSPETQKGARKVSNVGRTFFGKNNAENGIMSYLDSLGEPLWAEHGKNKNQVLHEAGQLLKEADGHTLIDSSIALRANIASGKATIQLNAGSKKAMERLFASENEEWHQRGAKLIDALVEAEKLEKEGVRMADIWDKTGWIKKSDGKWRFQFYDGAEETIEKISNVLKNLNGKTMADVPSLHLADLIDEDNVIYEMYPELKDLYISFYSVNDETLGGYKKGEDLGDGLRTLPSISFNLRPYYKEHSDNTYELSFSEAQIEEIANTFFHELQHAIQDIEGLESGSNLFIASEELNEEFYQEKQRLEKEYEEKLEGLGIDPYYARVDYRQATMTRNAESAEYRHYLDKYSPEERRLISEYVSVIDSGFEGHMPFETILDRYENNLGEIEAREEAENALNEIWQGTALPTTEGYTKSDFVKSELGVSNVDRKSKYKNWDETRAPITLAEALDYDANGKSIKELADMAERIRQYVIVDDVERIRNEKLYTLDAITDETRMALEKLDEIAQAIPKTIADNSPERMRYREELLADMIVKTFKDVPKNRKAYIVLGPSASGKSSFINKYLKADGGVVDSDEFKFATKEFETYGGIVSDALHAESDELSKRLKQYGVENGYNLTFPLVGRNTQKIVDLIHELQNNGYSVNISSVTLPAEKAQYRALNRFIEDDRYLRLDYMRRINNDPINTYNIARAMEGVEDGGLWNTDVEFGKPYVRIEESQGLRSEKSGELADGRSEVSGDGSLRNGQGRDTRNTDAREISENESEDSFSNAQVQFSKRSKKNEVASTNAPEKVSSEVVDDYGKRRKQQFRENNLEKSTVLNEEQKEITRQMSAEGLFTYQSYINKVEVDRARDYMKRDGIDKTFRDFMGTNNVSMKSVVKGEVLLQELAKKNDPRWEEVATKLADDATVAGQALQAYAILQRLSPENQWLAVERNMRRMQAQLDNKYGDKAPHLEIAPELEDELRHAKTAEQAQKARDKIMKSLIEQQPITFGDMINSWRYLSMLGNTRTHIRNVLGNALFMPMIGLKNAIGTALESMAGEGVLDYKTKSFVSRFFNEGDRALYQAGKRAYNEHRELLEKTQKYEQKGFTEKTKLGKVLNKADKANTWLLDHEDFLFAGDRYALTYAQVLKANGVTEETASPELKARANQTALVESLKATYRDANKFADWLNMLENSEYGIGRLASFFKKAIIPFTKTPFNIIRRGVRYSGIGLLESITYGAYQVRHGMLDANTWIDNMASGMSGSMIMGLGYLLAKMGILRGKNDDKDRKKYFDQDNGFQDYSINVGNGSETIDWATPVVMPLVMGAEIGKVFEELEGVDGADSALNAVLNISANIFDPIVETSMLSSLKDSLSSYSNEGSRYFGDIVTSAIASYIGQMFPTAGGHIARTIDDTRRVTSPNKGLIDKTWKQILNKIPFASKFNEPYINKSGEEQKQEGDTMLKRFLLNAVNPGYYKSKDIDKYDEELYRLYEDTGEIDVLPSSTTKSITYDKIPMKFSDKEYTEWHKARYSTETKFVNQFLDSSEYKSMSDEERVKTISDIRGYAQKVAKKQFLESRGYKFTDDKELAEKDPNYIYDKELTSINSVLKSGTELYQYYDYKNNAGTKQEDKVKWLQDSNLSESEKKAIYDLEGYKTSYEDVYKKIFGKTDDKSSSSKKSSKSSKKASSKKSSSGGGSSGGTKKISGGSSTKRLNLAKNVTTDTKPNIKKYFNAYQSVFGNGSKKVATSGGRTVVCPKCGAKVPAGAGRCPVCGTTL